MKYNNKRIIKTILFILFSLFNIETINAVECNNNTKTQGNEFWVAFLQNHDEELIIPHGLDLIISTEKATQVRIENNVLYDAPSEDGLYHWNLSLEANTTKTITVPCQLFNPLEYGEPIDRTLHIKSTEPISVYLYNHQINSSDATIALPTSTCDSYYIIQSVESCIDSHYNSFMPSLFSIIAFEDNTSVQITPTLTTSDGHEANKPYTVTLNEGQLIQIASTEKDLGKSFSGTQILALDGKKVAVYAGSKSANIPYEVTKGNSNLLYEASYPVSSWGKDFIVEPFRIGLIDMIKCTASKDNTKIYKDGKLLTTINAFESFDFTAYESDGAFKLESTEPIEVYQYMSSNTYISKRANGGPSMLYVNPLNQSLKKITFCTPNHDLIVNHFVNLVIKSQDSLNAKLDGKAKFAKFTPIDDIFSIGHAIIAKGQHTIETPSGAIVNVYGMGDGISYAYNAGSNTYNLNTKSNIDVTICEGDSYTFRGKDYNETGFYIDTLQSSNGCDSLLFLNLKVLPYDTVHYYDTITIGDSYIKNGFKYETPSLGVYDEIIGSCPHFSHLELVVEHKPCPNGTLIFKDDFGGNNVSDPSVSKKGIAGSTYEFSSDPRDRFMKGRYSIRKVSYPDDPWINTTDHTYPDNEERGYFMQCDAANNAGEKPGVLYSAQIDDLCDTVPFFFSFWGMSMIKAGADSAYAYANVKLVVEDTEGNVLREKNIVMPNGIEKWTRYGLPYQMPEGKTSAVFKILNNSTSYYGNDFAIDDIEVRMCKDAIEVENEENSLCKGTDLSLSSVFKNDGSYKKPEVYEWYYSKTTDIQSSDWVLVGNEKTLKITKLNDEHNGFYRVFVGNAGSKNINNNCSQASDMIEVNVGDCFKPICIADSIILSTCNTLDTMVAILDNDTIENKIGIKISLIDAPTNAKIVDDKLSYKLVDSKIKTDTIKYCVSLGNLADTSFVLIKNNQPSSIKKIDTTICSGSKYKELVLTKDTIFSDTTTIEETGCPSILNHVVNVINIDASINDTAICKGDSAELAIQTKEKYDFVWYADSKHKNTVSKKKTLKIKSEKDAIYYIVVSSEKCKKELIVAVDVLSVPYLYSVKEDDKYNLEFIARGGSDNYEYNFGKKWTDDNVIKNYVQGQKYNIKIRDDNNCVVDTTFKAPSFELDVPTLVTPNGDGINDVFEIKNIDRYPQTTVEIYERHGKLLLEYKNGEFTSWDGRLNGHRMHSDDYWYVIEITELEKTFVGHFTLLWDD